MTSSTPGPEMTNRTTTEVFSGTPATMCCWEAMVTTNCTEAAVSTSSTAMTGKSGTRCKRPTSKVPDMVMISCSVMRGIRKWRVTRSMVSDCSAVAATTCSTPSHPSGESKVESIQFGDQLFGGLGSDWLYGNLRKEVLVGGPGSDNLFGDKLTGSNYAENLFWQIDGGDDVLMGGSGIDDLFGGGGNDTLWGGADSDHLEGQDGFDQLYGGSWLDELVLDTTYQYQINDTNYVDVLFTTGRCLARTLWQQCTRDSLRRQCHGYRTCLRQPW